MKVYPTKSLRNVALVSHQGVGKTSLVEAMVFNTGAINRVGEVQQGTTVSDYDEEEIRRGLSLATSLIPLEIADLKLNVLDTPGYTDFQGDVKNALRVADLALILVDAQAGVEVGTELYWEFANEFSLPRVVALNKMDRDNIRPEHVLEELSTLFGVRFVPFQVPVMDGGRFVGVVDLLTNMVYRGDQNPSADIPADLSDAVEEARIALIEAAAEADDKLLEKYFDAGELSDDEIWVGITAGVGSGGFVPVIYTAGTANIGVKALTELVTRVIPAPDSRAASIQGKKADQDIELTASDSGPLALYVFKTTADPFVGKLTYFRVVSGTLKADIRCYNQNRSEEERIGPLLVMRGKEQFQVDTMHAGDIGAVAKLAHTNTGDTLGDKGTPIIVAQPDFPRPVYAVAVTPLAQAELGQDGTDAYPPVRRGPHASMASGCCHQRSRPRRYGRRSRRRGHQTCGAAWRPP